MRMRQFALGLLTIAAIGITRASMNGPRFYDDDPIERVPESRSAADAKPLTVDLFYEYSYNLFVNAARKPANALAGNVNTIDEVPDSSWFTNRIGSRIVTAEELMRGVNSNVAPAPERWV